MSFPTEIDKSAPVIADHHISIAASLDRAWQLHLDIAGWPRWQTDITEAAPGAPLAPGATFRWSTYGMTITSTVYAIEPGRRILWGGGARDIVGIHEWLFTPTQDGVDVRTLESFAGSQVAADATNMQGLLDQSLVAWLSRLKAAAEASP